MTYMYTLATEREWGAPEFIETLGNGFLHRMNYTILYSFLPFITFLP